MNLGDHREIDAAVRQRVVPVVSSVTERPDVGHCLGLGLALGSRYGAMAREWYPIPPRRMEAVAIAAAALRSYVVIDDHARDELKEHTPRTRGILRDLREVAVEALSGVTSLRSARIELGRATEIMETTYRRLDDGDECPSLSAAMRKCAYVFVPSRVLTGRRSDFEVFLTQFFVGLQLIDDFIDLRADLRSPGNHNVIPWTVRNYDSTGLEQRVVARLRLHLASLARWAADRREQAIFSRSIVAAMYRNARSLTAVEVIHRASVQAAEERCLI